MKINPSDPLSRLRDMLAQLDETERAAERTDRADGRRGARAMALERDGIELSAGARELARLRSAMLDSPEVREELVERMRAEIASGRYAVDGTRIADALMRESEGGD